MERSAPCKLPVSNYASRIDVMTSSGIDLLLLLHAARIVDTHRSWVRRLTRHLIDEHKHAASAPAGSVRPTLCIVCSMLAVPASLKASMQQQQQQQLKLSRIGSIGATTDNIRCSSLAEISSPQAGVICDKNARRYVCQSSKRTQQLCRVPVWVFMF